MLRPGSCQGSGFLPVVVSLTIAVVETCGAGPVLAQSNGPPADASQVRYGCGAKSMAASTPPAISGSPIPA